MLPPLFEDWFKAKGWTARPHQLALAESRASTLLVAPTGGGKTLAGFLPSLIDLAALSDWLLKAAPKGPGRGEVFTRSTSPPSRPWRWTWRAIWKRPSPKWPWR